MNFDAVILAGGKSSRMGRDKAWLKIDGQSLLARQIQLARDVRAGEVFISGRAGVDYSSFGCRVLKDRLIDAGPLGGIERALSEASAPLVLVIAVDMPKVTASFLRRFISRCDDAVGIVSRVGGEIEPLLAIYPKAARGLIEELFATRARSEPRLETAGERTKSPRATAFAEKCVERGLVKLVALAKGETLFFENWNSPEDVE